MMLVCIKTSIKASRAEDKAASEYEAANCCGLSGRKNNRYVRCSNGDYPRQNGLAVALREQGRIERTLFILDWLQSVELRRRVPPGWTRGKRATRWPTPCSSTAWAKSATAVSSSSATVPAASIW